MLGWCILFIFITLISQSILHCIASTVIFGILTILWGLVMLFKRHGN